MKSGEQMRSPSRGRLSLVTTLMASMVWATALASELHFQVLKQPQIESRLKSSSRSDGEREAILKKMFADAGCTEHLSEQTVKHSKLPNLVCILPGETQEVIIVGAHFDHADEGDGVVDNWSGASLLPSLYEGLRVQRRRHAFIFVAFAGEEKGDVGSETYVRNMSREDVSHTNAMINLECLGLGPTKVWLSHSETQLATALNGVANALKLPLGVMNVDRVGTSDSEQFAARKIPRITVHSVTPDTWPILHSRKDKLEAIHLDNYYDTYRLLAGYLIYLDDFLGPAEHGN